MFSIFTTYDNFRNDENIKENRRVEKLRKFKKRLTYHMNTPPPKTSFFYALKEAWYGFRPNSPKFLPDQYPNLLGKTAIITGISAGIGLEVASLLYAQDCHVIGLVRNLEKGECVRDKIIQANPNSKGRLTIIGKCDFCDLTTLKEVGDQVKKVVGNDTLNIIIHNAGLMSPYNHGTSTQGIEAMWSTNVMGPQLLQHFLDPLFLKEDDKLKRIVWVSSAAHFLSNSNYGIRWEDPGYVKCSIKQRDASSKLYGQSKAANIYQAKGWATVHKELVDKIGCISVSCYPGNLNTSLTRDWGGIQKMFLNLILSKPILGAYSELYGALSPDLTLKDQGAYIVPFGEVHDPREDVKAGLENEIYLKLWNLVEKDIEPFI